MLCKSYQLHHTIQDQIISSKFDVYCVLFLVITRSHRWSIFDEILPHFVLRIESGEDTHSRTARKAPSSFFDNFFTSEKLLKDQLADGVKTARKDRRGFPPTLKLPTR